MLRAILSRFESKHLILLYLYSNKTRTPFTPKIEERQAINVCAKCCHLALLKLLRCTSHPGDFVSSLSVRVRLHVLPRLFSRESLDHCRFWLHRPLATRRRAHVRVRVRARARAYTHKHTLHKWIGQQSLHVCNVLCQCIIYNDAHTDTERHTHRHAHTRTYTHTCPPARPPTHSLTHSSLQKVDGVVEGKRGQTRKKKFCPKSKVNDLLSRKSK